MCNETEQQLSFKEALEIASRIMPVDRVIRHLDTDAGSELYLLELQKHLTVTLYSLAEDIYKAYPESYSAFVSQSS